MEPIFEKYRERLERDGVLYILVKVIPKAKKTEFVEVLESAEGERTLKIKVAAVPEKEKANKELCQYLAKVLKVSKNAVNVVQGHTSPRKMVKVLRLS